MQKIIHKKALYAETVANQHLAKGWKYVACYAYSAESRPDPRYSGMPKNAHGDVQTQFEQYLVIVIEKEDQ